VTFEEVPPLVVGRAYETVGGLVFLVLDVLTRNPGPAWRVLVLAAADGHVVRPTAATTFFLNMHSAYHTCAKEIGADTLSHARDRLLRKIAR
jgi:hypothetical protein